MNAKAVLTFTFLVLFGNYAVIGESFVELVKHICKITPMEQLKTLVWRYFMSYWNNRRICSAIGGMPPAEKRRRYYASLSSAA